ncbi:MAG: GNAT family N-acetyltransferase [Gemmatimonadota bacterium]
MNVEVRDNPAESRYEILDDERRLGLAQYRLRDDKISFIHTEIDPALQGRGLAARLVEWALQDAQARRLDVLPFCPYVRGYIDEHRAFLVLVPEDRRGAFGLPD